MQTAQHYYISTLPALGELGSVPPIGLADLLDQVADHVKWREQVKALILLDDLMQREAFLAQEIQEVEPAVLSVQQVRGESPLPDWLAVGPESEASNELGADLVLANYFSHVHALGRARRSQFLVQWVEFEVTLRNALATARAKRLGLDEHRYLVAPELSQSAADLSAVLSEWEAAPTPLAGLRVAIRARWAWVEEHDAWFSFSVDELLAFAARVMLLEKWLRSASDDETAT